jgi:trehalose 6-phosphate phosphatase
VVIPASRLAPWLSAPRRAGVFTDFDGTLAPIVDDPAAAAPLPGAGDLLARLAGRYARVAVISGRPVAYLIERLGASGAVILSGLYGLERARAGATEEVAAAAPWREVVAKVAADAEAEAPAGVRVERKGLALTLHVRTAPEHAGWVAQWVHAQAARTGLVVHPGKMSMELRPPVQADKGTVVAELAAGLDAVCFLGDDRGDLPAFATLSALADAGVHTLAVAVASDEAPPELLAAADVVVQGPQEALSLLEALAGPESDGEPPGQQPS